jgi:hypothetical protein
MVHPRAKVYDGVIFVQLHQYIFYCFDFPIIFIQTRLSFINKVYLILKGPDKFRRPFTEREFPPLCCLNK